MNKKFLITAIAFYALALIGLIIFSNDTPHSIDVNPGLGSAAAGVTIIVTTLILCGSFFLYKYFTYNSAKN
ncbi:MAG: hypothetical protein ABI480_15150 [Chitinophagaceae bacterium]